MLDTSELLEEFGQPGNQRPGCGFPVAHLLVLFHAGTGLLRECPRWLLRGLIPRA
jgi:hypothetical protein